MFVCIDLDFYYTWWRSWEVEILYLVSTWHLWQNAVLMCEISVFTFIHLSFLQCLSGCRPRWNRESQADTSSRASWSILRHSQARWDKCSLQHVVVCPQGLLPVECLRLRSYGTNPRRTMITLFVPDQQWLKHASSLVLWWFYSCCSWHVNTFPSVSVQKM